MLALAPTSLIHCAIPTRDLQELHALTERNQMRIQKLLLAFDVVESASTLSMGYEKAATAFGGARGFSAGAIRRFHTNFRKSRNKLNPKGDWRTLIDHALEWQPNETLPDAFLKEVQKRADASHRSVETALKSLRTDWTFGKSIPGYGTWREWWMLKYPHRTLPNNPPGHPAGWSTRNLRRYLDSSKFRRTAQTKGLTAAKSFRPRMKHTRLGVEVGEIKQWDDLEHDFFANDFSHQQAVRPLELFCHDYAAAFKSFWGIKPKYKDDEGFVKKLSGDMMRLTIAGEYYLNGYHPKGTRNIAEHGTANFADDVTQTLYDSSGGLITLEESGFDGRAPHAGLYHGRPRGQPGHKASLESSNNLTHNLTGSFPGQTGRNVENRPENLHGLLTHNAQLIAAREWLPAEFKEMLDFPLWEIGKAQRKLAEVYHQIGCERDHKLEGWKECGHVTQALEFNGVMMTEQDFKAMPPTQRTEALALIQVGLIKTKPVHKSRWEVYNEGRAKLIKISGGTVCKILGESFMHERTVHHHQIIISDKWSHKEELWFFGHIITPDGRREELTEGQKYQFFLNPFCPNELFVRDVKGRYLGIAPEQPMPSRGNPDASRAAALVYAKEENTLISKLTNRQLPAVTFKANRHKNNAATLKKAAAVQAERTRFAAEALDAALPTPQDHDTANNNNNNNTDTTRSTDRAFTDW